MKQFVKSFGYAWQGLNHCFLQERNFKIHTMAAATAVSLSLLLKISTMEWIAVVCCMALVMAMEMVNTSLEQLCNLVYPGRSNQVKKIKDMAAGAVLLCAGASAVCGSIIFIPKIFQLF